MEEQLEVFATVMLIGGGAKGLQLTLAGFQYVNTFHYEGKEITLSPTVMDALSTLVNSKSREVFDARLTQLLDTQQISQEEYTLAQKLANEVSNFDHQIEAERESLKHQLMNGSDIDLQAEYTAYQEVYTQLEAIKEQYRLGTAAAEYTLNPSVPNLQLDIMISNETELDTWMREMKEALDFIEGVADFKAINLSINLNENVTFEESSLDVNQPKETWNGYTNIFKANADEILEATNKIKNHRITQNTGTQGNYGYLEGNIGNVTKNGDMVRSGPADDITEVFDAVPVNAQQVIDGDGAWLRNTDSEYKMLNRLANEMNAVKGEKYPQITGELKIVSERPYCPSCQGIIQQFHEMYPNVKLILVDGAK